MEWGEIIKMVGASVGDGATVGVFLTEYLKRSHEGRIAKSLEEVKSRLARYAIEHEVQFSHVYSDEPRRLVRHIGFYQNCNTLSVHIQVRRARLRTGLANLFSEPRSRRRTMRKLM